MEGTFLKHRLDIGLFQEDTDGTADSALSHCGIEVLATALDGCDCVPFDATHLSTVFICFSANLPI